MCSSSLTDLIHRTLNKTVLLCLLGSSYNWRLSRDRRQRLEHGMHGMCQGANYRLYIGSMVVPLTTTSLLCATLPTGCLLIDHAC